MEKSKFTSKSKSLAAIFALPPLVLGATFGITQKAIAASPKISCNVRYNVPNVIASFTLGDNSTEAVMLQFLPEYFSAQDGKQQCQSTATALQKLYDNDEMKYLASDTLNESPVVCAVSRRGNGCDSYNAQLLFTVDRQVNPTQVLYNMLGNDFKESELPVPRTVSRIYTDLRPRWWPF